MYRIVSFFVLSSLCLNAKAQTYTLQQCIDSAVAHNIQVRQFDLNAQAATVNLSQARSNQLPNLSLGIDHGINQGRSIDPFSNGYVNQNLNYANYQMNSGIVLFNGGNLRNIVRQNVSASEAAKMEWQQQKDKVITDVIIAYLKVLADEDKLVIALKQVETSQKQVEHQEILNKEGAIKPSDLTDIKGQLLNDQLSVVDVKASLETSKLSLSQLMNKPYNSAMRLERLNIADMLDGYSVSADEVYRNSLQQFSLVKAIELRRKSYEYAVKAAKGGLFPTVTLGGGVNTNYSSVAQNASGKISYNSQLKNNVSNFYGVGLSIPIFNRMRSRNLVKLAEIDYKTSQLDEEKTKIQLYQEIEQAFMNMKNAYEKYNLYSEQIKAYTESFNAAEARYVAGVGTSIDYLLAKDRMDKANINLVIAKYEFVLRKKVLDYYQGK
jgi:outer membrane protein